MKSRMSTITSRLTVLAAVLILSTVAASYADVYVDNGGPGTSSTGTWSTSSGPNSYGTTSVFARPEATYTWEFSGQPAGSYEVLMWWTVTNTRGTAIDVRINTSLGPVDTTINQLVNGGQWNSLGTYMFDGSGSVTITASGDLAFDGRIVSTCADAVWFRQVDGNQPPQAFIDSISPNPAPPGTTVTFNGSATDADGTIAEYHWVSDLQGEIGTTASFSTMLLVEGTHEITFYVVDNEGASSTPVTDTLTIAYPEVIIDNNLAGTSFTGTWRNSSGPNSYGTTSIYARPDATYTWTASTLPPGEYEVAMWWTTVSTRGSAIPVSITSAGGTDLVSVDQRSNGGQWNVLGTYSFNGTGVVTVTATDEVLSDGRTASTCADAVRFRYVGPIATDVDNDGDGYTADVDCDDSNAAINPGATEVCDTIDNNCDGLVDEGFDLDGDGFTTCGGDCDDTDAANFPGNTEICDGADNDCNGLVDDVLDADGDGFTICLGDCDDSDAAVNPGATEVCDTIDNNCDGNIDEGFDADGDGFATCGGDCDDTDGSIYPGATEICGDSIDQDCSGADLSCTPAEDVIIDNNLPGTSFTGLWRDSSGANSYGTTSIYARPDATYTWATNSLPPGIYEVAMWWTTVSTRGSNIPVSIISHDGLDTVYVNQQANGGQWNVLGTYAFDGSGSVTITASGEILPDGRTASTCADAVRFRYVSDLPPNTNPPVADFSADLTVAATNLEIQFTDLSTGNVDQYQWSFGDGAVSTERNPKHAYTATGKYTVSLTVTNPYGTDTETKVNYIEIVDNIENIYIVNGYVTPRPLMDEVTSEIVKIGAYEVSPGVWTYTNTDKGVTYYIREASTTDTYVNALHDPFGHIVIGGHSNYGSGLALVDRDENGQITSFDDYQFYNGSSDIVEPNISGMINGNNYVNWSPYYADGTPATAPYTLDEGIPPYNYYLTYQLPGDPTYYKIEQADGSPFTRFNPARTNTPVWDSPYGPPDPVANPEYFITNPDPEFNHWEFVGNWPIMKLEEGEIKYYSGVDYRNNDPGTGAETATMIMMVRNPGYYQVLARWQPRPENATNAVFTIHHADGVTPVTVDQQTTDPSGYNDLGTYYFNYGGNQVVLTDNADGYVVADRIDFVSQDDYLGLLAAEFSATVQEGAAPLVVDFSDKSLYYGTSRAGTFLWDFGDGTTSTDRNPQHEYTNPGVYTVSLTVTDTDGNTDTEIKENFIIVDTLAPLTAQFLANTYVGWNRLTVYFTDQSSGEVTGWLWDFGDGGTSTEQNPFHVYNDRGDYTVTLTVTGPDGSSTTSEVNYIHMMSGTLRCENDYMFKPHYYSTYRGRIVGKVMMSARKAKLEKGIDPKTYRYKRMFYATCFTGQYYMDHYQRGIMFFTYANSRNPRPEPGYVRRYMEGQTDDQILAYLNALPYEIYPYDYIPFGLYGYYDFTQKPPSMR